MTVSGSPRCGLAFALLALVGGFTAGALAALPPANPAYQASFPVSLAGTEVRSSSVALGDLTGDGIPEIVVGGADGMLYAYRGNGSLLWQTDTGAMAIESKPAIGDVDGDGFAEVVVGTGSTIGPQDNGRLFVFNHLGVEQCHFDTLDVDGNGLRDGIFSTPALADLDRNDGGRLEIVFGAWDQKIRALHDNCTLLWERDAFDTIWSSPAIGDLDRDGDLDVVIGADSHFNSAVGMQDGGRLFALDGATGADLPGFPKQFDEVLTSSPALGDLDGDGFLDIVVGTGNCWGANNGCGVPFHPGVGEYVIAVNRNGANLAGWPVAITGRVAVGSPALADLDEDGQLEVVINAYERPVAATSPGWVYALKRNGTAVAGWPKQPSIPADCNGNVVHYGTAASPIVADINGDGHLEVILPSNWDLVVWNRQGTQLSRASFQPGSCATLPAGALILGTGGPLNGGAAVGDIDGDGDVEVVVGGFWDINTVTNGGLWAWDFAGPRNQPKAWPQFRARPDNRAISWSLIFEDNLERGSKAAWSTSRP